MEQTGQSIEMSKWQRFIWLLRFRFDRFKRRLPVLMWPGDEVDLTVTLKDLGALGGQPSHVWEAQEAFNNMGIWFDTGSGEHGRDWEWDYSLQGPISLRFRGKAKKPERRTARQKPKLIVDNSKDT